MKALLIVDLQNDFCENGALEVKFSLDIIPVINKYICSFLSEKSPVIASRDWHPESTPHFKTSGGIWPVHCVKNTHGAAFHPELRLPEDIIIVSKGTGNEDGFSAFEACCSDKNSLKVILDKLNVSELYICGLASDYCVKSTVMDALRLKYKVCLLVDAIKGVELNHGDSEAAISEMAAAGAELLSLDNINTNK